MRKISFTVRAFEEFESWAVTHPKTFVRLNRMIRECIKTPFEGIGKPEPLKGDLSGLWSRRITQNDRLIYAVSEEYITIIACKGHYEDV